MEPNPTQYPQMADIPQEDILPLEGDKVPEKEDPKEDNDSEVKNERDEE